jgi:hypothetical protein
VELSDLLERTAGTDVAAAYRETLFAHYWRWRWLGVSDFRELGLLRRILMTYGLMKPNPDPGWVINRGVAEYIKILGPGVGHHHDDGGPVTAVGGFLATASLGGGGCGGAGAECGSGVGECG